MLIWICKANQEQWSRKIGFDSGSEFLFIGRSFEKNVNILGADMSSSVHTDNKGKIILSLGEEPTQGLDDNTLTTESICPINFIQPNKRFLLSLHYKGRNSFLFVNVTKIYQFKPKNSEIKGYALYLGRIPKVFTINNMKKQD